MGLFDLFKKKPAATAEEPPAQHVSEVDVPDLQAQLDAPVQSAVPTTGVQRTKLRQALNRTRAFLTTAFTTDVDALVDEDFYDVLLDGFIRSDVGTELSSELMNGVRTGLADRGLVRKRDVPLVIRDVIAKLLSDVTSVAPLTPGKLSVLLIVGVNGSGKTTLSAKLANRLRGEGFSVLLAAADTFRAAATDQLRIWAQRAGVEIVSGQEGSDPAAVVFDAAQAAASRGTDVLIVDTAGRLQTRGNLMAELGKIARTVEKAVPGANIVHILVLDATVGQNAISQAELFNEVCPLSGLALNKIDGTAKGGAILAVVDKLRIPVLYLGVGEQMDDLLDFDAAEFAAGLVPQQ
ncbi:MAG: signal recognition particle-docking protein FtsY [bacterium]|nr:signal recognition particle-docking protein FtsY [bacterium]